MLFRSFSEKRLTVESIHVILGLTIFYLTIFRLIYKSFNPTPTLQNSIFSGQKVIAKLNHIFLYIAVFVITISGVLKKLYNGEMINLIGDDILIYRDKKFSENEFFFDYLKKDIKNKRKMGHITIIEK